MAQAAPSPAELAARIQARYATIRDFTADFTLTQTGGLSTASAADRGKVSISKPGRMRWTLETGSHSEVISDGVQTYVYFPQDNVVQVTAVPKNEQPSSALSLLTGRGNLTRDFAASAPKGSVPAGTWAVTLTPRTADADFTSVTLIVDPATLQLRGLDVVDSQKATQVYRFTNLRENQGVKDSVFAFTIPKGVELR
jgi:outer membrane lipoprotein carrier protein